MFYDCELESERDLSWDATCLIYTREGGGKWWKIAGGVYVEVLATNVSAPILTGGGVAYDGNPATINQTATHRFVSDTEKAAWEAKQNALGFTPVNTNDARLSDARNPTAHSHTKSEVGLSNVDNTTDALKPVSTAQQTALNLKLNANDASVTNARTPTAHGHPQSDISGLVNDLAGKAPTHSHPYEPVNSNIQAHIASAHAPSTAQKNSDIVKAEIEAKLTGIITSHSHAGQDQIVVLGADVTNNNAVANTLQDVTGLSFAVTAGLRYKFRFVIYYTAAAITTGSRWSINAPASTFLNFDSRYSLTITTETLNHGLSAVNTPAASNISSAATGSNKAVIEGIIIPSANGTVIARFASEILSSAIIAKIGSHVEFQQI